ncbi:predicted protein [Histoplasma mississippiense (nom. inval.)]|uniref:predicted protein n=1 Tax=Ajellomyces capsulatus (strain NAm1 / WU24) TaxID=2059318 RepID=UPI000157BE02|nr:predicted protein [Histoplasma mississippiense (nom. inval.)]EDN06320.1 predicted protein [Histoplasma mississippiense (nom. inval.)]
MRPPGSALAWGPKARGDVNLPSRYLRADLPPDLAYCFWAGNLYREYQILSFINFPMFLLYSWRHSTLSIPPITNSCLYFVGGIGLGDSYPLYHHGAGGERWVETELRINGFDIKRHWIAALTTTPLVLNKNLVPHIRNAGGQGVSLVALPEYHLTGLVTDCPAFVSPRFKSVGLGSKSFGHQPGTLVTTDPNSLIRKRHGSSRYSVIKTPLGQVRLVTFPEAFRAVTCQGARIIIIPGFWLNTEITIEARKCNEAVAERAYGVRVDIAKPGWHYGDGYIPLYGFEICLNEHFQTQQPEKRHAR